jgi:very-short-patch-repair endonuclease
VTATYRDQRRTVAKLRLAKGHRRQPTDAEQRLWSVLKNRQCAGYKFRREHEFGPYLLDFYCPERSLVVEADGGQHYATDGSERDEERTGYLNTHGIRVLRFSDREILMEMEGVFAVIEQAPLDNFDQREEPQTS